MAGIFFDVAYGGVGVMVNVHCSEVVLLVSAFLLTCLSPLQAEEGKQKPELNSGTAAIVEKNISSEQKAAESVKTASAESVAPEVSRKESGSGTAVASVLRAGDVLSITVFRVGELSKSVRVEENGTIRFPYCGEIEVCGLPPSEVAHELEARLSKQIAHPQVDVFVSEWSLRTVYILGEVKKSMSLELPTYARMTALQAISAAGGFTESADLNHVAVLRRSKTDGKILQRLPIDVTALVSKSSGGDDFLLQPEDTIVVPKAFPVYVSGLVGNGGAINIDTQRPPLCSELVARCGGLLDGADQERIVIARTCENGERKFLQVSLRRQADGSYANDIRIEPGDNIMVSTADRIYVLGEVANPGPLTLHPDQALTASQAIALAGGFKVSAKQSNVMLVRGSEFRRLNLKNLYEDEDSLRRDVELQNGDILFVKESMW